jgi:CheY-like chemotaxis protein
MSHTTLLVLCGNTVRRESFLRALSGAGWSAVLSSPSLSGGVGALREARNVCVIVDAELDDIAGLEAAQVLRRLCPHAKVIFTAPENTRDLEARVRAIDVFYYYVSSADRAELAAAVEEAIGAPRPGGAGRPFKVLIVDDDRGFHQAVGTYLKAIGYRTVSAYSQREGLDMARRERPDAILLDIIMGSTTDGFEFCHEARRDPAIKHTPIIGISAIEERVGVRHSPDHDPDLFPVDGFLSKPVELDRLASELKKLIPREG